MAERKLYITQIDKTRLGKVIAMADGLNERDRKSLNDLAAELERAEVVPSKEVPPNVVTMNSKVVLRDMEADEKMTYTLVFPDQADINEGRISVLAPVGTAILGYTEGDVIEWPVPSGVRLLRIEQVLYQPEAAGDYHL
ncbi:MAG: nucleoside diphosphate kinase regulator [Verrucomicrobiales bacterium]|nr:nucleoside diphosphate kinase regulator [Verrucomicrobiales bacterium]